MITTIIACIIANILTAAIVAGVAYYFYKKNEVKIKEEVNNIKEKIDEISGTISSVTDTMTTIKEKLDKLPF